MARLDASPSSLRRPLQAFREFLTNEITPDFSLVSPGTQQLLPREFRSNSELFNVSACASATQRALANDDVAKGKSSLLRAMLPGSQRACVLTFVATALGSGVLALPYAFSLVGVLLGVLMLSVAAMVGALSLSILMITSRYTEAQTMAALLALATQSSLAGVIMDAVSLIYGFAIFLALLIFEGDFVPAIMQDLPWPSGYTSPGRTRCILGTAVLVLPLVIPSQVSALRYVAACSPFAILIMAFTVILEAPAYTAAASQAALTGDTGSELKLWDHSISNCLKAASIFFFSVMCHGNAVLVAHMLERPSAARIVKVSCQANLMLWVLYSLIGIFGYLSFRAHVHGDFLLNYPITSVPIQFCRVLLASVCFVGIPINSPFGVQAGRNLAVAIATRGKKQQADPSAFGHALLATFMLGIATVSAIKLTDVAAVISALGGSLTTLQMFWLPALVYRKVAWPTQPAVFRNCAFGCLLAAGLIGFASLAI